MFSVFFQLIVISCFALLPSSFLSEFAINTIISEFYIVKIMSANDKSW